jgi:hypothetical protein
MAKQKNSGPVKATTLRLPEALVKTAKLHAVRHDTTLTALVIEGLRLRLGQLAKENRE